MDRIIVYPGAIPLDTDLLSTNRNTMLALHALIAATLGSTAAVDGLAVTPTLPASMSIVVSQGSITQYGPVDANAYGSLATDTLDQIVKMGVMVTPQVLSLAAPSGSGTSINYLLQASFSEVDQSPVVLPYYNAANPAQPYLGPGNDGVAQNTLRQQTVQLTLKQGAAAPTGSQITPPLDSGAVTLAVITVGYGATAVTSGMIASAVATRFVPWKLPDLRPGFPQVATLTASGTFVVPAGITRAKVTVIAGGGAGGYHASQPGGGGGSGGQAMAWLSGLVPGNSIPVSVGAGGAPPTSPTAGGAGQGSAFGSYVSATGGQGGGGGTGTGVPAGGQGGSGVGGAANFSGSWGGDAIPSANRGGDGGGPGAGKGGSGATVGQNAPLNGVGGGGGGGGSANAGGAGGGGLVIVEY
jgi:hypothetical protein